jgi:hypothetical protein
VIGNWYEVWVDDTLTDPYILIVTHDSADVGRIIVIDPLEGYATVRTDNDYEAVKLWLLEDEYRRVDGRMRTDEFG